MLTIFHISATIVRWLCVHSRLCARWMGVSRRPLVEHSQAADLKIQSEIEPAERNLPSQKRTSPSPRSAERQLVEQHRDRRVFLCWNPAEACRAGPSLGRALQRAFAKARASPERRLAGSRARFRRPEPYKTCHAEANAGAPCDWGWFWKSKAAPKSNARSFACVASLLSSG